MTKRKPSHAPPLPGRPAEALYPMIVAAWLGPDGHVFRVLKAPGYGGTEVLVELNDMGDRLRAEAEAIQAQPHHPTAYWTCTNGWN